MLRKVSSSFFMLLLAALTTATATVHAKEESELPTTKLVTLAPIQAPAGTTAEIVRKAVRKSLYINDWELRDVGPGHLEGRYIKGGKYAIVVDVKFDAKGVSIAYKHSTGLNYSSGGTIHKTYNDRITVLDRGIRAELDAF